MNLLLTNDDGIYGEGLTVLASALIKAGHAVTVVAPDCNNSAVSHKINMRDPLSLTDYSKEFGYPAYTLSGTPADCVMFALKQLGVQPHALLSGINDGMNLGSDCLYSGTVAAAQEGAQNGLPSLAFSANYHCTREFFQKAADFIVARLKEWIDLAGEAQGALNVNLPVKEEIKGVRLCRCAKITYYPAYERQCSDGKTLYRYNLGANRPEAEEGENDVQLFRQGYVTLTPLLLDQTDHSLLERWKK